MKIIIASFKKSILVHEGKYADGMLCLFKVLYH